MGGSDPFGSLGNDLTNFTSNPYLSLFGGGGSSTPSIPSNSDVFGSNTTPSSAGDLIAAPVTGGKGGGGGFGLFGGGGGGGGGGGASESNAQANNANTNSLTNFQPSFTFAPNAGTAFTPVAPPSGIPNTANPPAFSPGVFNGAGFNYHPVSALDVFANMARGAG